MKPIWKIVVGKKADILCEVEFPQHQMGTKSLKSCLKSLYFKASNTCFEATVDAYKNRNKRVYYGSAYEVQHFIDLEQRASGFWCGDWDCYVYASEKLDGEAVEFMRKVIAQNRGTE